MFFQQSVGLKRKISPRVMSNLQQLMLPNCKAGTPIAAKKNSKQITLKQFFFKILLSFKTEYRFLVQFSVLEKIY